jgi:hypothetical protein
MEAGAPAPSGGRPRFSFANPSGIIAAELGQTRIIRGKGAKGLKQAFKSYIADEAVIFAPDAVNAREYWRKTGTLPIAPERSPYSVWMSCDGTQAVVQGVWRRDAAAGTFISVWERQKDGGYKWVMTREDNAAPAGEAPEMLTAKIATCRARPSHAGGAGPGRGGRKGKPPEIPHKPGMAADETLRWQWHEDAAGNPLFVAEMWTGGGYEEVLKQRFPAGGTKVS